METFAGPTTPGVPTFDVASICKEEEEGEPVRDSSCYRSTKEAEVEGVNKDIIESGVDRGCDEKDISSWSHYL